MILWLTPLAFAAPRVGLELQPGGSQRLSSQATASGLGEFDPLLRPGLGAWVGLSPSEHPDRCWQLSLSGARAVNTRWDAGAYQRLAVTTIRPGAELQWGLGDYAFGAAGLWAVVPVVRDRSSAYGPAEQAAARETARGQMAQLAGVGVRLGAGADLPLKDQLSVGAAVYWALWRGQTLDEESWRSSALGWTEVVVRVSLQL